MSIAWLPARRDLTGLHHAIAITYRPPCSVLSASPGLYLDLPLSPPLSPGSPMTIASSPRTIVPSPYNDREKTLSVIYSPHGVSYDVIRPYASSHLVAEAALPLTALIHSFDRVQNVWYLGGNISTGSPGGLQIARNLYAQAWISAHDADKHNRGLSVKQVKISKSTADNIRSMLQEGRTEPKRKMFDRTEIISLASGDEHRIERG